MTGALVVQADALRPSDLLEWAEKRPRGAANTRGHGRPDTARSGRRGPAYLGCRMKRCTKRQQAKSFAEFYPDRSNKTGYRSWCKTCLSQDPGNKAARQRYWASERGQAAKERFRQNHRQKIRADDEARRQAALARLDAIKLERGCIDCGYRQHPAALDFDHRDPTTKATEVSQIASKGWDRVLAEVAKCDVRCANCHRIRTVENKHGRRRQQIRPDDSQGRLL